MLDKTSRQRKGCGPAIAPCPNGRFQSANDVGCEQPGKTLAKSSAIRPHNPQRAIIKNLNVEPALVHGAMVEAAQRTEIGRLGLAAIRPADLMQVNVARIEQPGNRQLSRAVSRRRSGARCPRAADVERPATSSHQRHDAGIAGEAARGLGSDGRAVSISKKPTAKLRSVRRRVHDDLLAIRAGDSRRMARKLRHAGEGVGARALNGTTCMDVPAERRRRRGLRCKVSAFKTSAPDFCRQMAGEDERAVVVVAKTHTAALLLPLLARHSSASWQRRYART